MGIVQPATFRQPGVLHRQAVAAPDKLAPATVVPNASAHGAVYGGQLLAGTTYNIAAAAGNRYGVGPVSPVVAVTTGGGANDYYVFCRVSLVPGAEFYDLFCSTDAAPKWIGRITDAQFFAGYVFEPAGWTGPHLPHPSLLEGTVSFELVGTGLPTTDPIFAANTAYTPTHVTFHQGVPTIAQTIPPVKCAGHPNLRVLVRTNITDFMAAPVLVLIPFLQNQITGDWHAGPLMVVPVLSAPGATLMREFDLDVMGAQAAVVLVDNIVGCTVDVYAETV